MTTYTFFPSKVDYSENTNKVTIEVNTNNSTTIDTSEAIEKANVIFKNEFENFSFWMQAETNVYYPQFSYR
jgi:hypothetical protein